ncbi:hypothetical protein TWF696_004869 [Orbilia brochopaga]|uniref:IBR domain-containing protein n=1 Tax=Orbilia brochopaga TaxID=3140254 RepID=A0AAV9V293_9PEZI
MQSAHTYHRRVHRAPFRALYRILGFPFVRSNSRVTMAGGEPIPENPLIGQEVFPLEDNIATVAAQKQPAAPSEEPAASTSTETPEEMATVNTLEGSAVLTIPSEEQEVIKSFWATSDGMEEEKEPPTVDITLPEHREAGEGTSEGASSPLATEEPAATGEASTPEAVPAENPPADTPAEVPMEEPRPAEPTEETPAAPPADGEAAAETPAAAPAPEPEPEVPPAPVEPPPKPRREVVFRRSCATCEKDSSRKKCYTMYCQACGDYFAKMFEDEVDNEELRAKVTEDVRPACNPGSDDSAYCKQCLLDWFDNCISWPHREPLPKHDGHSMLPIVEPFVSAGYMARLKEIQTYWEDKEKMFCPVPTCSTYVPKTSYTVVREVEMSKQVPKPKEEEKKEETPETQPETAAAEGTTEGTTESATEGATEDAPAADAATGDAAADVPAAGVAVADVAVAEAAVAEAAVAENNAAEAPAVAGAVAENTVTAEATATEVAPTTADPVEPEATPTSTEVDAAAEVAAAEVAPVQTPAEAPAVEAATPEAEAAPAEATTADATPVDSTPADAASAEVAPIETVEAEAAPVEAAPAEAPATDTPAADASAADAPAAEAPAAETTAEQTEAAPAPEPEPEPEMETVFYTVEKEFKSQLVVCPDPACRTPICTLCRSHFHGLDTPCASRTSFFKSFMLAKYANPITKTEGEKKEGESNEEDGDDDGDDEYEEFPNRFRQCVNCRNLVARHTGCDHMTCACGYAFCFYCGGDYGRYHSCISVDEYKEGTSVGGIKITNEEGFIDEGAEVVVNPAGMIGKEEQIAKVAELLDMVEFVEGEETKKVWKVKGGFEDIAERVELPFSKEEEERLGKPMKAWKGRY